MLLSDEAFKRQLARVRLLALDVDGVMTDGGLYYTESGEELKKFNVKDGLGIKRVMATGIQVAIISANGSTATLHRAKKLGITHTHIGVKNKIEVLHQLCEELAIATAEVAYMGDDLSDLEILHTVGCPITVADAAQPNKEAVIYVTQKAGGQGAVREICDLLLSVQTEGQD